MFLTCPVTLAQCLVYNRLLDIWLMTCSLQVNMTHAYVREETYSRITREEMQEESLHSFSVYGVQAPHCISRNPPTPVLPRNCCHPHFTDWETGRAQQNQFQASAQFVRLVLTICSGSWIIYLWSSLSKFSHLKLPFQSELGVSETSTASLWWPGAGFLGPRS